RFCSWPRRKESNMALGDFSGVGGLIADPELRFVPAGTAVVKVRIAFNARKWNKDLQQWEDGDSFFIDGEAWGQLAENIAESLGRGMKVVVTGRVKTESWEDRNGGGKRSKPVLRIDGIGPDLGRATATVVKN